MEEKKEYLWKVKWIGVLLLLLLLISITKNVKAAERFLWPVPNYTNVYQSYSSEHQGIDISQGGIAGKPVVATKSGVVVAAKDTCNCGDPYTPCNCNGRQGNYVIIKHNDGGFSRYLHLQYGSVSVQVGQSVNRGAQIGLVGSSGESYGYHLHFDLATGSAWNLNNRYNPMNESYDYSKPIINDSFISYLERPASGGNYSGPIAILGYALHKNGIRNVTAWVNGQVMGCSMYNSPDVAKVYPGYPTGNEGFQTQIPISCLKEGENEIGIYAYEKDDTPHLIASHKFNWSSFVCKLESPVQNGSYDGTLSIQGYTLHKNGIKNVTAWVNGQVMDCPMYERKEIATKYPGYPTGKEGFKTEIPLSCLKNGENEIGVFAYEPNGGTHNIASYKFNYVKESQKPIISNVKITDLTSAGYTVTCDVNASEGLASVQFPTWSYTNGQDDLTWHEGKITGNTATCKINISDHKRYVNCTYQTDIYAYDKAGNCTTYINRLFPYIDATPPTISDVEVVDVSETGYTVKCKVTDNHSKIDRVQFPTWFEEDNPFNADWSWGTSETYSGKLEDGKYVFRVNTSKYKNQTGKYHTHIYAWDEYGNQSEGYATETIITKAHKHEYTSSIKKPATCTEPGIRLYTCKDNDDSYEEEIPATGHQHTELRNVKQATCAHAGYTGDTYCKDCNAKLSSGKTIAKKAHTWDAGKITKQATCTVNGTKTYTCTSCKTTKTSSIAATGHTKELRNVKTATCAHAGYTGDTYCKKCNKKLAAGKTIAQKAHTWNKGVVTTAATCTKQGVRTYTCTVCKGTRKAAIAATGHRNKVLKNARQATCAKAGYTGDTYCKDCNAKLSSGKTIAKKAHTWDAGKVTKKATCTVKGTKTYTCKICKATKTSSIAATGHRHTELRNVKKATCGQEGYTGDTYCKDCKAKVSSGKVIAKTPHKNKIVKFAKESTCKSEGYTGDIFCYDCGSLIEEGAVIDKLEHIWDSGKITVQPTAAKTGVRTYTCENCGATKKTTIPVLNLVGKTVRDKTTNGVYKVLSKTSVEYTKPIAKRAAVNIPATVKLSGKTFNVTKISANAFRNNTVMKSLTIGSNVTTIGANAFYGCKNLNTVVIKTAKLTTKTVGANAFAKTGAKPVVTVPAKQFNTYKTLLRSKGISTKAVYKK